MITEQEQVAVRRTATTINQLATEPNDQIVQAAENSLTQCGISTSTIEELVISLQFMLKIFSSSMEGIQAWYYYWMAFERRS